MNKWEIGVVISLFIFFVVAVVFLVHGGDYSCGYMYNLESSGEYIGLPEEVIRDMDIG